MSLDSFARKHYILSTLFVSFCLLIFAWMISVSINDDWSRKDEISNTWVINTWKTVEKEMTKEQKENAINKRMNELNNKDSENLLKKNLESWMMTSNCKEEIKWKLLSPKQSDFNLSEPTLIDSELKMYWVAGTVDTMNQYWVLITHKVLCKWKFDWFRMELIDAAIL